ncbi:MAG: hypothetical protein VKN72_04885 [Nostocales cyanobacterium 94392]|nr:hypothetical protein [Nostocales cyanobacterium 94392]
MKRSSVASLSVVALIAGFTFGNQIPVVANLFQDGVAVAQNAKQGQVQLRLKAEKKIVQKDAQGKQKVIWQELSNGAKVQQGEVLRYSISGANNGEKAVNNLAINQPIPKGMVYVLNSATVNKNTDAQITYSINGGKTFVKNPTVEVKLPNGQVETRPAPDTAYTHIRWNFGKSLPAKASVDGTYQVKVR